MIHYVQFTLTEVIHADQDIPNAALALAYKNLCKQFIGMGRELRNTRRGKWSKS